MSIKKIASTVSAVALVIVSTAAQATMVQPITGEVMINQGKGYKTIKNPIEAKAGDRVIVNPGGYAKVNYSDGCNIPIQPGAVATIGAQSPCIAQQGEMVQTQDAPPPPADPIPPLEPVAGGTGTGIGTGTLVAVGLGVAAAVGIGIAASSGGSKKRAAAPASP